MTKQILSTTCALCLFVGGLALLGGARDLSVTLIAAGVALAVGLGVASGRGVL